MKIAAYISIDTTSENKFVMNDNTIVFSMGGVIISFEPEMEGGASIKRMAEAINFVIDKFTFASYEDMKKMVNITRDFNSLAGWQYQVLDTVLGFKDFEEMDF